MINNLIEYADLIALFILVVMFIGIVIGPVAGIIWMFINKI